MSCVRPDYMSSQEDINEKMRAILIDWLIEVEKPANPEPSLSYRFVPIGTTVFWDSLYLFSHLIGSLQV